MPRWLGRALRRLMVEGYGHGEQHLQAFINRTQTLRGELQTLYDELELAMQLLDQVGERAQGARQRLRDRQVRPPHREPMVLTPERRQDERGGG